MNSHMPPDPARDSALDTAARAHYRNAAVALPPSLQGRLRAARRTAMATPAAAAPRRLGMPLAATAVAVLALGLGLRMQGRSGLPLPPVADVPATVAASSPTTRAVELPGDAEAALLTLEDDPDFYLWLGAGEADSILEPSPEDCCDEPS